jgi:hypothetical protein
MTLSLKLWNSTGTALDGRYEAAKLLGVLWFFNRPQVSPLEKQRNQPHDIWCLITNTWANKVTIAVQ